MLKTVQTYSQCWLAQQLTLYLLYSWLEYVNPNPIDTIGVGNFMEKLSQMACKKKINPNIF